MSQKTKIICGAGVLLVILIVTISVVVISTAQSPDQANNQTTSNDSLQVFDKTDHSDPTMHCDEFDLKKISNMTRNPKIIIIGKIFIKFHIPYHSMLRLDATPQKR
jgi:hypothetical protein